MAILLAIGLAFPTTAVLCQQTAPVTVHDLKRLSVEELMDLEVTSVSKRPERLMDVASAIQVITRDDIVRSGATSLPEALRLASNLVVAQVDSRQWAISARGFNSTTSNKLLVLIDGRSIYTPLYAGVFWDAQDVALGDVDRIEVISGPGATVWGANAVNGVINITTRRARETQGLVAGAGAGSWITGAVGARYGGAFDSTLHFRVYGKTTSRGQTQLPTGSDAKDQWRMAQGGFRADWDRSAADHLTLQGDIYGGEIAQPTGAPVTTGGVNVLGRWSRDFSPTSSARLRVYFDRTHRKIPGTFTEDLDTYDAEFLRRFSPATGHDVLWGLGYRWINDSVTNSPALAFLPPVAQLHLLTGFVQDEIALVPDKLHMAIGTKLEHNDYTGVEVDPTVRLSWRVRSELTLWGAASRAVRAPSRIDRELYAPAQPPYSIAGGPGFRSEKLVAYELGYRARPAEALAVSLATFYNAYDDIRSLEKLNPPAPAPIVLANGQRGESHGAELTVDLRVTDRWRLLAGYTEFRMHLRPKPGSNDLSRGSGEAHDPDRQVLLRSSLEVRSNLTFDAGYRFVDKVANQAVPAYQEIDARLAWRPTPRISLSLEGRNLLHDRHAEFGAATARKEIARSVFGRIQWQP